MSFLILVPPFSQDSCRSFAPPSSHLSTADEFSKVTLSLSSVHHDILFVCGWELIAACTYFTKVRTIYFALLYFAPIAPTTFFLHLAQSATLPTCFPHIPTFLSSSQQTHTWAGRLCCCLWFWNVLLSRTDLTADQSPLAQNEYVHAKLVEFFTKQKRWNPCFSPKPWVHENKHKVAQVFLMLKLSYTKIGCRAIKIRFLKLACPIRMVGLS